MATPFHNIHTEPSKIRFPVTKMGSGGKTLQIGNREDEVRRDPRGVSLDTPSLYLNSELSLLRFQRRVLEEVHDPRNPLIERVKFLAILSSNLDEFFMVRVAGLLQQIESGVETLSVDGRPPGAQLEAIRAEGISLIEEAYATYQATLVPELAAARIKIAGTARSIPASASA